MPFRIELSMTHDIICLCGTLCSGYRLGSAHDWHRRNWDCTLRENGSLLSWIGIRDLQRRPTTKETNVAEKLSLSWNLCFLHANVNFILKLQLLNSSVRLYHIIERKSSSFPWHLKADCSKFIQQTLRGIERHEQLLLHVLEDCVALLQQGNLGCSSGSW